MGSVLPRQREAPDHLLDYRLAAAFFNIPTVTLRRWIHAGKLRRYGDPRRILVDVREVQDARDTLKRARTEART